VRAAAAPPARPTRPPLLARDTRQELTPEEHGIPDLLHATPLTRVDLERTRLAIALAFAGGVSGGLFAEALDQASIAPSTWQPGSFAADLFLPNFVALCFRPRIGAHEPALHTTHLVRLLASPPTEVATVIHRREVLAELASTPELRGALERLYTSLCRFRTLLEGATGADKWDVNRRRLDILALAKEIVDAMATGFVSARSGLARLHAFGRAVQSGEPYRSLTDLLRYDEQLGTLDLKVSVGADGRIRGFEIVSIEENLDNPFVSSPWTRWLAKLELFVRGYSFGDGEVMARLIDAVFDGVEDDIVRFVQLLGDVEFYLGALGFHDLAGAAGLGVSLPDIVASDAPRELVRLFNPLLLAHGVRVVPCDVRTDRHDTTVLVTGPNSGGKTRLLQSLGLAQLLAQSGLFVPAATSSVCLCPGLVVSLIEEARPDQAEGRLGTELVRIRGLFERLPPGAMVILDELCSGTNPSEGEEIFELVVRMLARLGPQALITTHFLAFAARLERAREREGKNAELRFLQVELGAGERPTYQFVPGVARTSLAGQAAARLGVTGDQLMALIERNIQLTAARTHGAHSLTQGG
jgi:DNA mismatch repair protein MutS2